MNEDSENLLRDGLRVAVPVDDAEAQRKRRERLILNISDEIAQTPLRLRQAERKKRYLSLGRVAAAAAVLLAAWTMGGLTSLSGQKFSSAAGTPEESSLTAPVQAAKQGDALRTRDGETQTWRLPGDTMVRVFESSAVEVERAVAMRQELRLQSGRIEVEVVPKSGPQKRFVRVVTPHAHVEVKGTSFSVDVSPRDGVLSSQVSVSHGVVLVRHARGELTLRAGDSWSSRVPLQTDPLGSPLGGQGLSSAPSERHAEGQAVGAVSSQVVSGSKGNATAHFPTAAPGAASGDATSGHESGEEVSKASTLGEENRLFEKALAQAEAGHTHSAIQLLNEFLSRYPASPLAGTVRAKKAELGTTKD